MRYFENILELVGDTPIVKLGNINAKSGGNVFLKLEFLNPGGSIKDRMVKYILDDMIKDGLLKNGSSIVENSSGNTGSALCMFSAVNGFDCTITLPDKMSAEKISKIEAYGGKTVITKTDVPAEAAESYYSVAKALAVSKSAFYLDQYNSPNNRKAHYETTGPEIWEQCEGELDYLVAGIGTGGTLSGVGKYLKEKDEKIKIIAADPVGSVFYDYFKSGILTEPKCYDVEGIGEDYLVGAIDFDVIDDIYQVTDEESFSAARALARKEGILAGGSTGSALTVALKLSEKEECKGKNILVLAPDSGQQYLSKFHSDKWFFNKGYKDILI